MVTPVALMSVFVSSQMVLIVTLSLQIVHRTLAAFIGSTVTLAALSMLHKVI